MLPEGKLQNVMRNEFSAEDAAGWRPLWLVRYAEYYKNRGVVRSKGYTFFAERDLSASVATTGDTATSSANGDQRTSF
ncbi:unnamed protein product [Hydatigera taeniaeformis]|uniref:PH domain-containing protein n=1 Tax=Hydatigena taeniaeformis TaxID=6205 RepID=A0A0R3XCY5_HYDTA|nr:unnamed protein product [Hydatigera taeniaeformis]